MVSRIFDVIAFANSQPSGNGTLIIIPPQALFWQIASEAGAYDLNSDPGNVVQQSVGGVGRNRFSLSGFGGVPTYNDWSTPGRLPTEIDPLMEWNRS